MQAKKIDYLKGLSAEAFAASVLKLKGYTILEKRFKTPYGEIDLICKKNIENKNIENILSNNTETLIIACEIKYRKAYEDAVYSITHKQQQRIIQAFEYWLQKNLHNQSDQNNHYTLRLDAFVIYKYGFKHLENAWQADF
jgi:putative endonuclease